MNVSIPNIGSLSLNDPTNHISSHSHSHSHSHGVPDEEGDILNYLTGVRSTLSKMKQDRTEYMKSQDIQRIYQEVLSKVRELDDIRRKQIGSDGKQFQSEISTLVYNPKLHNRVDSILDDVFQLLSLCFLTVGLKNSAPATYASLSTVQSLLEHLMESKIYTHHDLKSISVRLNEIAQIVEQSCSQEESSGDPERYKNKLEQDLLLKAKLKHVQEEYKYAESQLESIDPSLESTMERLFQLRRNLISLITISRKSSHPMIIIDKDEAKEIANRLLLTGSEFRNVAENTTLPPEVVQKRLDALKAELAELEANRDENGYFRSLETNIAEPEGQNILSGVVRDCHELISDLTYHNQPGHSDEISSLFNDIKLQTVYEQLSGIKTTLENLMITRRWTLRETDLYTYRKKLQDIDNLRVNGRFPSSNGATGDNVKGQTILLYLLRRCYAIIYKLLESSEPVSEALQPLYNQLSTVRRCLIELQKMGGVDTPLELYPYQMKLASLDNMRKDGKFYDDDGNIPEGQGILNALLANCYDILHELKIQAEEREEKGEKTETDDGGEFLTKGADDEGIDNYEYENYEANENDYY